MFSDTGDAGFDAMFNLVLVLVGIGFVAAVVIGLMNFKKAADAGVNPLTMETEAMTRLITSDVLAPEKSVEQRLAELDALQTRGVITATEHAAARAEIIKDL